MTPLKSIRKFCLDCYGGNMAEVLTCPPDSCEFSDYRMGRMTKKIKGGLSKLIRKKCTWCMGGNLLDIRTCVSTKCATYGFRMGKNINRKGNANNMKRSQFLGGMTHCKTPSTEKTGH